MIDQECSLEIRILHRQGVGVREIARRMGVSRNTVRKYLRDNLAPEYGPRTARPGKLDAYKKYIVERVEAALPDWIPATVIDREIRVRGYVGSIRLLRYFMASLRPAAKPDPLVRGSRRRLASRCRSTGACSGAVKRRCQHLLAR